MTPTQAQIEAAAKAIMKTTYPSAEAQARAALTAAAEVGPHDDCGDPGCCPDNPAAPKVGRACERCGGYGYLVGDAEWEPYAVQCPDCAAAAEVGEKQHSPEWHIIQATIERCAQELDRLMMRAAAAAVRALKDKP